MIITRGCKTERQGSFDLVVTSKDLPLQYMNVTLYTFKIALKDVLTL